MTTQASPLRALELSSCALTTPIPSLEQKSQAKPVFGTKVTSETLNLWRVDGKTHGVGLMELYAAVAALKTWANIPKVQHVI